MIFKSNKIDKLSKFVFCYILLFFIFVTNVKADEWFVNTPLKQVYSALSQEKPLLAWNELKLALKYHNISPFIWKPIKKAIIENSNCGKSLSNSYSKASSNSVGIKVSVQKKTNLFRQVSLIKISVDNAYNINLIKLIDPNQTILVSRSEFLSDGGYIEIESPEKVSNIIPGIYNLIINDSLYNIILTEPDNNWLTFVGKNSLSIGLNKPNTDKSCLSPTVFWQFFDSKYNLLSEPVPIRQEPFSNLLEFPKRILPKSKFISAVVLKRHYQSEIIVEQLERLTLPINYNKVK